MKALINSIKEVVKAARNLKSRQKFEVIKNEMSNRTKNTAQIYEIREKRSHFRGNLISDEVHYVN